MKPLYTIHFQLTYEPYDPKRKPGVFEAQRIGEFHNERPGAELEFVYGRKFYRYL